MVDITGQQFGELIAIKPTDIRRDRKVVWEFQCSCGVFCLASGKEVRKGHTKSCGHIKRNVLGLSRKRHGQSGYNLTPEYRAWMNMKARTKYGLYKAYEDVSVCQRWLDSFEDFLSDVGIRPSAFHSLDRINPFGDYKPNNCRWATKHEQANNTRRKYQSPDVS